MQFCVSKIFHPVGQGLFSSTTLRLRDSDVIADYVWVYDCGTHSGQALVNREIGRFAKAVPLLDMLVISHFDADHISGVSKLIGKTPTRRIVLPYMTLAQRLLLAFDQGLSGTEEIVGFFINPAAYLVEQADDPEIEFLFVPPHSPDESSTARGEDLGAPPDGHFSSIDRDPDSKETSGSFDETIDYQNPVFEPFTQDIGSMQQSQLSSKSPPLKIALLKKEGRIVLDGFWEFVPYNDPLPKPKNFKAFSSQVERYRKELMDATSEQDRQKHLQMLKDTYDKNLRGSSTSEKRNRGSLYLFEGPLLSTETSAFASHWPATLADYPTLIKAFFVYFPEFIGLDSPKRGFLMTGDGMLKLASELTNLQEHFGPRRMTEILSLQVMHHGSKYSWHKGVASSVSPTFSIFCADPKRIRPGHPHRVVWTDFASFRPMLADQHQGVLIHACYTAS